MHTLAMHLSPAVRVSCYLDPNTMAVLVAWSLK
jgi:hypothetical protein